jgi:uncharacterized protein (TIGR02466 family)
MRIQAMFPVPFAFERHADAQRLNARLRELFLAREAEGARYANPTPFTLRNAAVFESHFDLFAWPQPEIAELRAFCLSRVAELAAELNGYDEATRARLRVRADAWFHVTRRGGYFGVHNHPMASWSGVYCVAPGEHDAGDADSGALTFVHPQAGGAMYVDAGNAALRPPFGIGNLSYRLEAGQLLIFPSWVLHQVQPFHGEGERITVAFNCAATLG